MSDIVGIRRRPRRAPVADPSMMPQRSPSLTSHRSAPPRVALRTGYDRNGSILVWNRTIRNELTLGSGAFRMVAWSLRNFLLLISPCPGKDSWHGASPPCARRAPGYRHRIGRPGLGRLLHAGPADAARRARSGLELRGRRRIPGTGRHADVHAGTYDGTGRISITVHGSAVQPVLVRGAPGEARPLITSPAGSTRAEHDQHRGRIVSHALGSRDHRATGTAST